MQKSLPAYPASGLFSLVRTLALIAASTFLFSFQMASYGATGSAGQGVRTIVFFGDSLTAGYGLENPGEQSYPALIQDKISSAGLGWRVVNAGLSGDTTAGGLRRVDWILRQPIDIFVLALGANDGLRGVSPSASATNLQQIIDRVRAKYPSARIVIAGMQLPPSLGLEFTRQFGEIFPALAKKNEATLIPFLLEGVGGEIRYNLGDRIHPNPEGHKILSATVWKALQPLL